MCFMNLLFIQVLGEWRPVLSNLDKVREAFERGFLIVNLECLNLLPYEC